MQINTTSAAFLAVHQQAADELGGNQLSGAGEEGLGECWEGPGGLRFTIQAPSQWREE
jgi:hypothetical protein